MQIFEWLAQLSHDCAQAVDACAVGQGTAAQLLQVWRELRVSIETWLQARDQPSSAAMQESRVHASAVWAVQALQDAARLGSDALVQVDLSQYGNNAHEEVETLSGLLCLVHLYLYLTMHGFGLAGLTVTKVPIMAPLCAGSFGGDPQL